MSNVPLPEPDIVVDNTGRAWSASMNREVDGIRYYAASHLHAHAAAVSAAKDAEIAGLRAELLKSLADNAPLREQVRVLEDARPEPDCRTCQHMRDETACAMSLWGCTNGDRYEPLPPVRIWRKV